MAKMRQLNPEERKVNERSIIRIEEDLSYLNWLRKCLQLDLDEGLFQKYKAAKRQVEQQLKQSEQELGIAESTLKTLKIQLKEGVVTKEEDQDGHNIQAE